MALSAVVLLFGSATDVSAQLNKLQHISNLYYTEPCAQAAKLLCEKSGMKKVFFGNSGAEANEGVIKAARKYSFQKYGEGRNKIVALENSFHGRTMAALSATGQAVYHNFFFPFVDGFVFAQANNVADTLSKLTDDVCAVMMEMVQGEGGVMPLEKEYVQAVYAACQEKDILFIVDEVQTGIGRTGSFYSYQQFGIQPDLVSSAKGLGGGLPIGACMMNEKMESVLGFGDHGSTYGGNPVCCAGALSVLERLDDAFLAEVKEKSAYVFSALEGAEGVEAVSGMGLMIGIKTVRKASDVVADCMKQGVLCLTAKDKVRLLPSLNIPMEQLQKAVAIIKTACAGKGEAQ